MSDEKLLRADAHIHLFRGGYHAEYNRGWARQNELQCYESLREKHGISRALVVGYEGLPQFAGNNADLAEWAQSHHWMAPLFYVDCKTAMATIPPAPFVGIALYPNDEKDVAEISNWAQDIYDNLNQRRAIISLNIAPKLLEMLAPFVEKLESCAILISHLGLPGQFQKPPAESATAEILRPLCDLAKYENLRVKISGLYAISNPSYDFPHRSALPILHRIYEVFGAKRLLWGSDFAPCLEHISFVQSVAALDELNRTLQWSEAEMQRICGGNLLELIEN